MSEKNTKGFWAIELCGGRQVWTSFHVDETSMKLEVAKALKKNEGNPPPFSETEIIVIDAIRYSSS